VTSGPSASEHLFAALREICPQFGDPEIVEEVRVSKHGFHCVMYHFTEYLGESINALSEQQRSALGDLINESVSVDDDLENAVSTCLLEHLHQIDCLIALSPYLSTTAKQRTYQ
jgi:hypothetical protein